MLAVQHGGLDGVSALYITPYVHPFVRCRDVDSLDLLHLFIPRHAFNFRTNMDINKCVTNVSCVFLFVLPVERTFSFYSGKLWSIVFFFFFFLLLLVQQSFWLKALEVNRKDLRWFNWTGTQFLKNIYFFRLSELPTLQRTVASHCDLWKSMKLVDYVRGFHIVKFLNKLKQLSNAHWTLEGRWSSAV